MLILSKGYLNFDDCYWANEELTVEWVNLLYWLRGVVLKNTSTCVECLINHDWFYLDH